MVAARAAPGPHSLQGLRLSRYPPSGKSCRPSMQPIAYAAAPMNGRTVKLKISRSTMSPSTASTSGNPSISMAGFWDCTSCRPWTAAILTSSTLPCPDGARLELFDYHGKNPILSHKEDDSGSAPSRFPGAGCRRARETARGAGRRDHPVQPVTCPISEPACCCFLTPMV